MTEKEPIQKAGESDDDFSLRRAVFHRIRRDRLRSERESKAVVERDALGRIVKKDDR